MNTILIVEDDASRRASFVTALAEEYLVAAVSRVHDALAFLEQHKADLVIFQMPGANGEGVAVLSHVAGIRPRPQVVVLTTLDQTAKAVKAFKLGADEYLIEPCDPQALRTVVQRALADRPRDAGTRACREAINDHSSLSKFLA
jgi:DNA-binding NtrC family response regulator